MDHIGGVKVVNVQPERRLAVGVDLGKASDPTAICVIEKTVEGGEGDDGWYFAKRNVWTQRKIVCYGLRGFETPSAWSQLRRSSARGRRGPETNPRRRRSYN